MFKDFKPSDPFLFELAKKLAESRSSSLVQPLMNPRLTPPIPPPKKDLTSPLTKKWNPGFYNMIRQRIKKNTNTTIKRIRNITKGLTMPEITGVPIGGAKKMEAAVLFFDLEDFTATASKLSNENVLYILNIIIPEMMFIIKYWKGEIEKNTGDGLMAICGTEMRNSFLIARDTIESAMTMRYIMLNDIQPKLRNEGLPPMSFRIGIDMGEVLISRIGISNDSFLTVIGDAANRASKLQELAYSNGICIGENFYRNLASMLSDFCSEGKNEDWKWHDTQTRQPYRFFHFACDWPDPREWIKVKL